ncbi:hypothetical protein L596_018237 [Steinernema carpocapsae]|uniref:Uncharacterized protein n=1 Tax=Steinernema carpocapsae TaxID=34508 RepID=A0A4U5N4I1_STECR|nr:hypothetical protein L596_018237 [Steinernema carpocapsae]
MTFSNFPAKHVSCQLRSHQQGYRNPERSQANPLGQSMALIREKHKVFVRLGAQSEPGKAVFASARVFSAFSVLSLILRFLNQSYRILELFCYFGLNLINLVLDRPLI